MFINHVHYMYAHYIVCVKLASFPGARKKIGEEHLVSTVHAHTAPQVFWELENYCDTSLCAWPYITDSWESLHLHTALFIQQSHVVCPW